MLTPDNYFTCCAIINYSFPLWNKQRWLDQLASLELNWLYKNYHSFNYYNATHNYTHYADDGFGNLNRLDCAINKNGFLLSNHDFIC